MKNVENDVKEPVEPAGVPFVSPLVSTQYLKRNLLVVLPVSKRSLGVDELLLEVFLELKELDDKLLISSVVVHGRKKLQTLASTEVDLIKKLKNCL